LKKPTGGLRQADSNLFAWRFLSSSSASFLEKMQDVVGRPVHYHGASILIDAGMDEPDSPWGWRNQEQILFMRIEKAGQQRT
jgi:hypothetical protein